MSEVDLVIIGVKCVSECQSVVSFVLKSVSGSLVFDVILIVANVRTNSMPASVVLFGELLAVRENTHALVVETIRFRQIDYVEPYFVAFLSVTDTEEIPLRMTVSVDVVLKDQIIFVF